MNIDARTNLVQEEGPSRIELEGSSSQSGLSPAKGPHHREYSSGPGHLALPSLGLGGEGFRWTGNSIPPGQRGRNMATVLKLAGLSSRELIRIAARGAARANVTNRAAELAFWFLLGFFPMLLCVTSIVSMIGSAPGSQGTLMKYVGEVLPSTASRLVQQVLAQTTGSGRIWLSLLFALWSSSSATAGLIGILNAIYDLKESRPWWKSRLL